IQLVQVLSLVLHELPFTPVRELQVMDERVAGVMLARVLVTRVPVTVSVPVAVLIDVPRAGRPPVVQLEPVALSCVGVITGIKTQLPSPTASAVRSHAIMRGAECRSKEGPGGVGWFRMEKGDVLAPSASEHGAALMACAQHKLRACMMDGTCRNETNL